MEEIFKKLKTDFEYVTGFIYKGLVQAIGAGFASRLSEFTDKLDFIKKQAFTATADKDYLYLDASDLLPPKPAEIAEGLVAFYGEVGGVIPASSELKDDDGVFKTKSDVTIAELTLNGVASVTNGIAQVTVVNQLTNTTALVNSVSKAITIIDGNTIQFEAGDVADTDAVEIKVNTALASVLADEAGVDENRSLNDVLRLKISIELVNTECGVVEIIGGVDDEDVEDYRQRVIEFKSNPQAPFSAPHIEATIKEDNNTIRFVWVKGGEVVEGAVNAVCLNENYGLTANESTNALASMVSIKSAPTAESALSITSPTVTGFDIVIEDLLPASDGLKNEIEKNLKYFFLEAKDADFYEKEITTGNIESIIYRTINGAEQVESFTLISGSQTVVANTFWKLENVIFQ